LREYDLKELTSLKTLLSTEGIGPVLFLNLLSKFSSAEEILSASHSELKSAGNIGNTLAKRIIQAGKKFRDFQTETENEIDAVSKLGGEIITFFDTDYPALLKQISSPPIALYVFGSITEEDANSVAIVGTRRPTSYGKRQAERFSKALVENSITIVSGLARGIDTIAHNSALKFGGRTIAVIGSGLDVIYPSENKKLARAIAESGAVISEYPLGTKPDAQNFPKRNRIIAGLSRGSLIVETKINGGAMYTANFALEQNREVFAVPGNIEVPQSEGTNFLIKKSGAKLVQTAQDIFDELNIFIDASNEKREVRPPSDLTLFEQQIFEALSSTPIHVDKLAESAKMNTSECLVHLLTLEFKGLVQQHPGKTFTRTI